MTAAAATGMNECDSIMHYIQLSIEEARRFRYNTTHPQSQDKKLDLERSRFFAIFKAKYLELTDIEYPRAFTDVEAKMVKQLNESLLEKNFTCDEFLSWLFDVFLPVETKFSPPAIKFACSGWVVNRFLFENKDVMKLKAEQVVRQKQVIDLVNRARVLIRQSKTKENAEEIKNFIKKYQSDGIMSVLRDKVEFFENQNRVIQSQVETVSESGG
jgi:hypothetical protein